MKRVLLVGCGYLGLELYQRLAGAGREVFVLVKETASVRDLAERGIFAQASDIADYEALPTMEGIEAIIHCASSNRGGEEAYRRVFVEGTRNLLRRYPGARYLLTSSTSVYGQADGEVVDEDSPAEPTSATSRILREAEEVALAAGGIVARLAGIYGPGRWAQLRRLREGAAVLEEGGHRWQNQVHRDDAAAALAFLLRHGQAGGVYNVTDDEPLTQRDLYRMIAEATSLPQPPEGPANLDRKRGVTSKRVSNARLRDLGWAPRFPTVAEALRADPRLLI